MSEMNPGPASCEDLHHQQVLQHLHPHQCMLVEIKANKPQQLRLFGEKAHQRNYNNLVINYVPIDSQIPYSYFKGVFCMEENEFQQVDSTLLLIVK
ncbi:hypothetical protein RDI58_016069 [Solanum bulbocastanum]|uniref:Uncharacterized protein n=1 Tax=Solanum bulbocastanum TaxID=147425 RepID=A0AAN8TGM8_SOLBU